MKEKTSRCLLLCAWARYPFYAMHCTRRTASPTGGNISASACLIGPMAANCGARAAMVRRKNHALPHDDDVGRRLLVRARSLVTCLKLGHLLTS